MPEVDQVSSAEVRRQLPSAAHGPSESTDWRTRYLRRTRWMDAVALALTVLGTQLISSRFAQTGPHPDSLSDPSWTVGVALGLVWWTLLELRGSRNVRLIGRGPAESRRVVGSTLVLFGAVALALLSLDVPVARAYVLVALPLGIALLVLGRYVLRARLVRSRRRGRCLSRTMVVGQPPVAAGLVSFLRKDLAQGFDTVAVYAPPSRRQPILELRGPELPRNACPPGQIPSVEGIVEACREHDVRTVVLSSGFRLSPREIRRLTDLLADEDVRLVMASGPADIPGGRVRLREVSGSSSSASPWPLRG